MEPTPGAPEPRAGGDAVLRNGRLLRRVVADPRWLVLAVVFVVAVAAVWLLGNALAPIGIAFVLAYFLDGGVVWLRRRGLHRHLAVAVVSVLFVAAYVVLLVGPLQLAVRQAVRLARALPFILQRARALVESPELTRLVHQMFPDAELQLRDLLGANLTEYTQELVGQALAGVAGATNWAFYLIIIPLLVIFFLLDKDAIRSGVRRLLPRDMELVNRVWRDMEHRMANYVRGKMWEILIVGGAAWVVFYALGFQYAAIMAIVTGLSVIFPYVGAVGTTIPVAILGLVQWGVTWDLAWLLIAYTVLQMLDGNVLVPVLFSEAVKLTPTVIMLSIIVFGTLWGFWGVFLSIPLATLVKTLLVTWIEYRDANGEAAPAPLEKPAPPTEPAEQG